MPIEFVSGGQLSLRQSLDYVRFGSRSPHPGWENNMTTILAQLGIPTILFWEVTANLGGYRVTHLASDRISNDDQKCGPWAQFGPSWQEVFNTLPEQVRNLVAPCTTPYQVHMALAKAVFPEIVESSAEFYLRHREIVEKVLMVLGESRFAGYFSKLMLSDGTIVNSLNAPGGEVQYEGGQVVAWPELAPGYLRLLELVQQADSDPTFNPLSSGAWGVLPDARIMSILDFAIFALREQTETVYAWSGTAMFQYILTEPNSQRWREVVSAMYDLVRQEALPELPEALTFVLIPTQGLEFLAVADHALALEANALITEMGVPAEYRKDVLVLQFMEEARRCGANHGAFLHQQSPHKVHPQIDAALEAGNLMAACSIAASAIEQGWFNQNQQHHREQRLRLGQALLDDNDFVLLSQPAVTPLELLSGQQLHLLDGVLDVSTAKLQAVWMKYQGYAKQVQKKTQSQYSGPAFTRLGWM